MDIKGIVKRLKKNHNTCDPFRERQANAFAIELLLSDEFLDECSDINFATLAKSNGISEGLEI